MRILGALLTLLVLQCDFTSGASDPIYLVAVTSQAVGGTSETLCAHVHEPNKNLSLAVTLGLEEQNLTILKENSIKKDFYKCVRFKVPVVLTDYVANVYVIIQGHMTFLNKTTKILIKPPTNLIFIQSDKPIYKPGETIKFRIVSLDTNFMIHNQQFQTVELQDPFSNIIGQWLNQTTRSGILDLSHPTTPHTILGYYTINAWDERNQQISQYFEIKEYVLPKFEVTVNLPPAFINTDTELMLQICAKYTYGKPVQGSVTAEVCRMDYVYDRYGESMDVLNRCKSYSITLDKTGCGSQVINVTDYEIKDSGMFQVKAKVEEDGTGIIVEETVTSSYFTDYVMVSFVDAPQIYRPGISYEGKILVSDVHSTPIKDQTVFLIVNIDQQTVNVTLKTGSNGTAQFSLNTTDWSGYINLEAQHKDQNMPSSRYFYNGYLWLNPFYSKSKSFLKLITAPNTLSCAANAVVEAGYIIQSNALKIGQKTLDFFYMVLSKGSMIQNGRVSVRVQHSTANQGKVTFTLKKTPTPSPFAQVVVYTILPNGETVADSLDFPIEQCLANKVSLNFSSSTAMPKEKVTLNLKAQPGSLCSVRSIDQNVLLLKPEAELNAAYVFGMLPVQTLAGYPYEVEDYENFPCIPREGVQIEDMDPELVKPVESELQPEPRPLREKRSRFYYPYYMDRTDAYRTFKAIGIKIATNSDVKEPVYCYYENMMAAEAAREMMDTGGPSLSPTDNIRKFFPETWIWDLVPVGKSGSATLLKTVPDSITKWATGAFCTSSVGFGVAPSTNLTSFLPFFVSLTLPYSVIRGETFTLKASVFNYLPQCIMVKVTLGSSKQFTAQPCNGCSYTQCICSEESKTFQWTVTPSILGQVNVTVKAEAVQTEERCGGEVVTVPEGRSTDTVVQSFLVEAEGIKQTVTHNELICLTDSQMNTNVPLNLPEVFVKDSAKSFVTVLGDLMGSALKNIENLLQMPYGCGEQNMLNFAPNIYILQYLESTGQLTHEILARAKTFLETGYQTELTYKHFDGSYSAFGNMDSSGQTWLTAYVMKTFGGAQKYVFIDQTNIDQAKIWLGQQQQENGCYKTVGILHHIDMQGGVSDDVTLTAYIVAALLELGVKQSDPMVEKGLVCLKNSYSDRNNTYFTALLSYTFTLADDQQMRQNLISYLDSQARIEGVGRYWTQENNEGITGSLEVETSAYVLLALLSGPSLPAYGLDYSATIVRWLYQKQNPYGGFSSTQDTVVALQALAKYSAATYSPEGFVVINVTSPSKLKYNFTVNQQNRLLYQEKQLQPPNGTFSLRAQGKGCVFVQFALHYNVLPSADSSSFSIVSNATAVCNGKNLVLTLAFTVRYKGPRDETNMMIIDVKLLSGFYLDETTQQAMLRDSRVKLLEQNEGHLILYLYGMKKNEEQTFSLVLRQDVVVKDLKPALVTVYDYYKTSEAVVSEYKPPCA